MEGYDSLSGYMGSYPEMSVAPKFSILNQRNLFLLETEIIDKERQIVNAIKNDRESEDKKRERYAYDFRALLDLDQELDHHDLDQKTLSLGVRPLLKEHNEFLLQTYALNQLPCVKRHELKCVQDLQKQGPPDLESGRFLQGSEYFTWDESNRRDLVSLGDKRKHTDVLSRRIEWLLRTFFHRFFRTALQDGLEVNPIWTPRYKAPLGYFRDEHSSRIANILTTVAASLIPAMSAFGLFWIKNPLTQMGMVVLLSFLFSITLTLVGVPRRIDGFVATSTFIAVLVVFVSGNNGCGCEA